MFGGMEDQFSVLMGHPIFHMQLGTLKQNCSYQLQMDRGNTNMISLFYQSDIAMEKCQENFLCLSWLHGRSRTGIQGKIKDGAMHREILLDQRGKLSSGVLGHREAQLGKKKHQQLEVFSCFSQFAVATALLKEVTVGPYARSFLVSAQGRVVTQSMPHSSCPRAFWLIPKQFLCF